MLDDLEGQNAIVTGASSGIGTETAYALAEHGANVSLASRSRDELEEIAAEIEESFDTTALVVETDVTEEEEVEQLVGETVEKLGGLDILVNNAGVGVGGEVEDMDSCDYHLMMDVNCDGMFYASRAAIPHLKESEGKMVFVASFAGQYPRPSNPVYAATKWWTRGYGLSLSGQLKGRVGVTVINPTEVRTDFASEDGDPFRERFEEGEVTEPEDIAEAVVFAARQEKPNTASEIDLYRRDKLTDF